MQKNKIVFVFFLLLLTALQAVSQEDSLPSRKPRNKDYHLILYVASGPGFFLSDKGAPAYLQPRRSRFNPVNTARIMWKPDHRVKVGFETGYMTFYKYKLTSEEGKNGTIELNAVPLLLDFSVTLTKRWNLFAGPGVYILNTHLDYEGKTVSKRVAMGWMAALAYVYPINKEVGIGAEAKWLYASESIRGSIALQAQLVWRFIKW